MTDNGEMEETPFGLMSLYDLLTPEIPELAYTPTKVDIREARSLPCQFRPMEIFPSPTIMDQVDYNPGRVFPIPHEPLHLLNKKVLDDSLEWFYQVIVKGTVMAKGNNYKHLHWEKAVSGNLVWRLKFVDCVLMTSKPQNKKNWESLYLTQTQKMIKTHHDSERNLYK
ncbi:hypothetical protein N7539_001205 [Penicillium diatomitis]|uniref:Uncharacterized protein n=1 Tax=Penicillium diatomitis TaxID=2819901 RepID=A0A9X0C3F9_9EURO|nr:uncharacterized protein N7539_001205 [Penicillium diatomitis]KAJ5496089.1 hypothetical protein N7539_001205 [Penicillium diatomitis]